jgi:hypothetical protein
MTLALIWVVIALAAGVSLLFGAQVEMFRDLQQLRDYAGLLDRPVPLELGDAAGRHPSAVGLPKSLDSALTAVVLLLSDKCATCRSLAQGLQGPMPRGLFVVVDPVYGSEDGLRLGYDLEPSLTLIDADRAVSQQLDLEVTPAAVIVEDGVMVRAVTVPSTRQLHALLEAVNPLKAALPQETASSREVLYDSFR